MSDSPDRSGPMPFVVDAKVVARLADLAPDPMVAHARGRVIWANEAAVTMLGFSEHADVMGRPVMDFVAPESRVVVADRVRRMLSDGDREPLVPEVFLARDGRRIEVEVSAAPIGEVVLVVGRDVTRRNQAERDRLAAATRFRVFFEAAGEPMCIARVGIVLEANPAFVALVGYDRVEEVRGLHLLSVISEEDRGAIAAFIEDPAGPLEARDRELVRVARRGGEERVVELRLNGYTEDDERYVAAVLRDVTAERAAEERLKQSERLEAVGRLAAGVAHDFNNILAGVLGFAELAMHEAQPGSDLRDTQVHIRDAALRARNLVQQILTVGRQSRTSPRPVDVAAIVREALGLARASLSADVQLDVDLDPTPVVTLADPTELHQVVMNLVTNARDALQHRGGRIRVTAGVGGPPSEPAAARSERWVQLSVTDDGEGMDEHTRARLFEPYMTTKRARGGHGLGLAVVHGIVSELGGVIEVDSALGRGTTFRVFLPEAAGVPTVAEAPAPRVHDGAGERVLLLDDDPTTLLVHRRLLTSLGYTVDAFGDPELALARVEEAARGYDLVITDQNMPFMSGVELAARVIARWPGTPVLVCSGLGESIEGTAAELGALSGLLQKPLTREALAQAVQSALEIADQRP
ncbi:MAG: hypothetical protein CVU56_03795 [Deltaproteobacteria bacterium HGW-Deltaproteobacteria-14]|jgi:PAS domain S-box-containing protein|nr:MAG: hypothetical protein CVU56_03795 [Deltaproteobacteria bacterium HGW-Deltaproteobacteria-14]